MKKCLTFVAIKEMQIKMVLRFHPTPVRKKTSNKCWQVCVGKRNLYTLLVGMQISAATMEISMEFPPKTKNRTTI
jgi:hypothetical protein